MLATLVLVLVQSSSSMSSVSGRVVDPSGGALTGATVSVVCGNHRATAATDSSGRYHVGQLPASRCRVRASLDGFASAEEIADLAAPAAGTIDFRLLVRPFAQQIVVTPTRGTEEDASRVPQAATRRRSLRARDAALCDRHPGAQGRGRRARAANDRLARLAGGARLHGPAQSVPDRWRAL